MGRQKIFSISVLVQSDENVALAEATTSFLRNRAVPFVVVTASSKRHPENKSSRAVGEALAIGRVLQRLGKRIERAANGYVKHLDDVRKARETKAMEATSNE
jgi:hypothetical protein